MKKQIGCALFACVLTVSVMDPRGVGQQVGASDASGKTASAAGTIFTFDVPGASCAYDYGVDATGCTTPTGVDAQGTVVGYYSDGSKTHSFYRLANGTTTSFDPPERHCASPDTHVCSQVNAISPSGVVVGYYSTEDSNLVGFQGTLPDRSFTTINVPGEIYSIPTAIGSNGTIAGTYLSVSHGGVFVLDPAGNYKTFHLPNEQPGGIPALNSVNSQGEVVGSYMDDSYTTQAFLIDSGGYVKLLGIPGLVNQSLTIDDAGRVIGSYFTATSLVGFTLETNGSLTNFAVPSVPVAVDSHRTIFGGGGNSGFYRLLDGALGFYYPPGATSTNPTGVNPQGEITGYFFDAAGLTHGFIRLSQ